MVDLEKSIPALVHWATKFIREADSGALDRSTKALISFILCNLLYSILI